MPKVHFRPNAVLHSGKTRTYCHCVLRADHGADLSQPVMRLANVGRRRLLVTTDPALVTCRACLLEMQSPHWREQRRLATDAEKEALREEGRYAYRERLWPESCPYRGSDQPNWKRRLWLFGWYDAAKADLLTTESPPLA